MAHLSKSLLSRSTMAVLFVVVAALVIGWAWRGHNSREVTFTTTRIKRGDVIASIGATGTIEPVEVIDVGAQVAGRISSFGKDKEGKTVDYGSVVEEGALLARIDDSVYAAELSVAKAGQLSAAANLEQMSAKLDQAAAEWKRTLKLFADKLISQVDYDGAKANYEVAKANVSVANSGVAQAKADLEKAERNLAFCTINSPVSGVIIDRRVNIGQTVVASLNAPSLFLIARDLSKMQIWAAVNEADVGRIKAGTPVTFTVDAFPGHQFHGAVGKVRLNATMTQNVVLYTVEIDVDNADKLLLPYLTASVRFNLRHATNALLVPNAALRWSPSSQAQVAATASRNGNPADSTNSQPAEPKQSSQKESRRTVWVKEGQTIRPVEVNAEVTDGANTAAVTDELHEGDEVVTGETLASATEVKNPFLPKATRR